MRYLAPLLLICLNTGCGNGSGNDSFGPKSALNELFIGNGDHSVRLTWNEPRAREDGSFLGPDLGYRVHVQSGDIAIQSIAVGSTNNVVLRGLGNSNYEFSVSSVDPGGSESSPSETVAVTIP